MRKGRKTAEEATTTHLITTHLEFVPTKESASENEQEINPFVIVDYLLYYYYAGEESKCFYEATHIPQQCKVLWVEALGHTYEALPDACDPAQTSVQEQSSFEKYWNEKPQYSS